MGQLRLTAALLMTGLFVIAIIGFVQNFAVTNDPIVNINDDGIMGEGKTGSAGNIIVYKDGVEKTLGVLDNSTITGDKDTLERTGQFEGGNKGAIGSAKTVFNMTNHYIFGNEQGSSGLGIFLIAIAGFIALAGGLYVWKTLRGNPD